MAAPGPEVRDAATVILLRQGPGGPLVLMGQRGAGAVFLPSKYVFPGGAVEPGDGAVPLAEPLPDALAAGLAEQSRVPPAALVAAAIRELWEEAGLRLARRGDWPCAPAGWESFAARGHVPDPGALDFVFRAVTPPGRPRRFDARFFVVDAAALAGDPDDFSAAEDELGDLHWAPLDAARRLDLPFVTEVALAEAAARLRGEAPPAVPFFRATEAGSDVRWLGLSG